jgi:hypothetical protein
LGLAKKVSESSPTVTPLFHILSKWGFCSKYDFTVGPVYHSQYDSLISIQPAPLRRPQAITDGQLVAGIYLRNRGSSHDKTSGVKKPGAAKQDDRTLYLSG